jgi:hypothetical protein
MSAQDLNHLVVGCTSQETALIVKNFMLNGNIVDVRYWVETNPAYGQRVIRQIYHLRQADWYAAKPLTNYSQLVVMFHDPAPFNIEEHSFNGNNRVEPVVVQQYNLNPKWLADDQIDQFSNYYKFDEYQRSVIEAYKQERFRPQPLAGATPAPVAVKAVQGPRSSSPALEAKRLVDLKIAEAKLRRMELENLALELKIEKGTAKPVAVPKIEKDLANLTGYYAATGKPFSPTQLGVLRDIAFESAHDLPGTIQPWHLDKRTDLELSRMAGERKIHFLDEHAEKLAAIADDPARHERLKGMFESITPGKFAAEAQDAVDNAAWYYREAKRREQGGQAQVYQARTEEDVLREMSTPVDRDAP